MDSSVKFKILWDFERSFLRKTIKRSLYSKRCLITGLDVFEGSNNFFLV